MNRIILTQVNEDDTVVHSFYAVDRGIDCDEFVQHVFDFMKGLGYIESSIARAMADIGEEYENL